MFRWLGNHSRDTQGTGEKPARPSTAEELSWDFAADAAAEPAVRRVHMHFTGEVQGVGFRWNARTCATQLGLTGWVLNEWDGSVTMELQGTSEQIALFFTAFNKQYQRFPINYVIDEKEDIPPRDDEGAFEVVFH